MLTIINNISINYQSWEVATQNEPLLSELHIMNFTKKKNIHLLSGTMMEYLLSHVMLTAKLTTFNKESMA